MAKLQSDSRIPNQGCTGYISGHPVPTGTNLFYSKIPRSEFQRAATAFSRHYKVDTLRKISALDDMDLGPSP